jgi:hypothetical protein
MPVQDDRPLPTMTPTPSLAIASPGSAFGFKPQTSECTTKVRRYRRAVGKSVQPADMVPDSEDDFEQAAQSHNGVGMDLDPEEYGVDLSPNVNDVSGKLCDRVPASTLSPHGLVYAFDLGPNGYDLSDEEGADSPRPRRLFRRNKQALSSGKFRGQLNLGAYSSKLS